MNLIPVSEIIELAKKRGIFLGKGTPQNRIAYFVKLGLIPHAIRKTNPKTGKIEAYFPTSILDQIEDINHLKRKGNSPFELKQIVNREPIINQPIEASSRHPLNLKFVIAGFSILLITLLYTNFILGLASPQGSKVLGVETFLAPVAEEVSPIISPIARFLSSIGNSFRLAIGTAILSLLPKDILNQTEKVVRISSETIPPDLTLSSLSVSGNSDLSTATIGALAVTGNETIGGTLIVTGDTTLKSDLKVEKNITLTGVINSTRITDNKLLFGGDSPSIYAGTTNTGISLNANGSGAISIGNSSKGDIYLGGGDTSTSRCFVTNASGNLTCSGDITVNGGDILTGGSTLRIGTSSTTVNIGGTLTVGSSTTTITGSTVSSGQLSLSRVPTLVHTGTWAIGSSTWNESDATIYVNPASATADSNIFALAVGGSVKFDIDAEGDVYANNLILTGNTTSATTTVSGTLTVEGNTTLGDATTDTLTINPATLTLSGGNKTIDITGAATRTLTILNSTASQVADLSVEGIYKIGSTSGSTSSACGASQYLGGVAVTGGIITAVGSCTSVSSSWSSLTDPTANLALSMGANTTTFTWNAATGASTNLFNLTDTTNNTGTGYLLSLATAAGSNALPLRVAARGNTIIDTTAAGGVTIGNATAAQAVTVDAGTGTLNVGNSNSAKTINIGTGTAADTINIGTGTTTGDTINIGGIAGTTINIIGGTVNVTGNIVGTGTVQGTQLISTVAQGTAPLTVTSTTVVANLNAATAQQPNPNLVLNSDFSRRNKWMTFMPETFADTSGWTLISGAGSSIGSVASNVLTGGNQDGTGYWEIGAGLSTWRDGRWSATFKATSTGVVAYAVSKYVSGGSSQNEIVAEWNNGNFFLSKWVSGARTNVSTPRTLTLNQWYWLELEAQGTTYVAKLYSTGTTSPGTTKASSTLLDTLSTTISDSVFTNGGQIALKATSLSGSATWGGLSTGDGGVYVEGWGPESWTPVFGGTKGGQAIGFDETADSGPLGYQWAMRAYIPAASRDVHLNSGADSTDTNTKTIFVKPSTTYTFSTYEKTSGLGGSGQMILLRAHAQTSALGGVTNAQVADSAETSWTRISNTIATSSTNVYGNMDIYINPAATRTGTAFFLLPQWEEGGVATPWRNAPADDADAVFALRRAASVLTSTTTSFAEIDSRSLAANIFMPWDGTVAFDFDAAINTNVSGNLIALNFSIDGTAVDAATTWTPWAANTAVANNYMPFHAKHVANLTAGKHRIAILWRTSAATTIATGDGAAVFNLTMSRGKFDLAEEYSVLDQSIEAGDVVRLASQGETLQGYGGVTTIERTDKGYDGSVLGIVSTAPGITLSSTVELNSYVDKPNLRPVALSGRVPVKVTNENGVIRRGDILTSSATKPGYAMKATRAGRSIGIAMEDFACQVTSNQSLEPSIPNLQALVTNTCTGKVLTFVNLSWYDPDVYLTDSGQFVINKVTEQPMAQLTSDGVASSTYHVASGSAEPILNTKYKIQDTTGNEISRVGAFNNLFVANLKVGNLDVSEFTNDKLKNIELRLKNLELATQSAVLSASISGLLNSEQASNSGVLSSLTVLGRTVLNDLGITGKVTSGLISIDGLESSITSLSDFKLKVPGGEVLIDKDGNLKVLNSISAKRYFVDKSDSSSSALGRGVIPSGATSIDILTSSVSSDSAVFVTPTVETGGQALIVKTKNPNIGFKVVIEKPQNWEINFDWFIIN